MKTRFSKEYRAFLKSPQWRVMRSLVIKRDKHKCVKCGHKGSFKNPLQCDHIVYPRHGASLAEFTNQPIAQLQTLCANCHKLKTKRERKKR